MPFFVFVCLLLCLFKFVAFTYVIYNRNAMWVQSVLSTFSLDSFLFHCYCLFAFVFYYANSVLLLVALACFWWLWAALGCSGLLLVALGCSGLLWAALGWSVVLWAIQYFISNSIIHVFYFLFSRSQ